ncbi:MAG: metallophosphoesterase family protein [Bryobacteraceae bacterium]
MFMVTMSGMENQSTSAGLGDWGIRFVWALPGGLADSLVRYLILPIFIPTGKLCGAVTKAAGAEGWDEVVCLGDIVGYGADPNACVDWVRANARFVIRGNHDKACVGLEDLEWFNPVASRACRWTQQQLKPDAAEWLRQLAAGPKPAGGEGQFTIAHGSPADEDQYVVNLEEAAQLAGYLEDAVTLIGHTHLQGGFEFRPGTGRGGESAVRRIPAVAADDSRWELNLAPGAQYLINPGSVGQPRDGDPRAAWGLLDPDRGSMVYHRVEYDVQGAQAKILAAGLPEVLAFRLAIGH